MSTLELHDKTNFKGQCKEINYSNADLSSEQFLQKTRSLRVRGDAWIVFSQTRFQGDFFYFIQGSYSTLPTWDKKISSAKLVQGGLQNPQITLYESTNYGGKNYNITQPTLSLMDLNMSNISSMKNVKGAWIVYSEEEYEGDHVVIVGGESIPDVSAFGWSGKIMSLQPLVPW